MGNKFQYIQNLKNTVEMGCKTLGISVESSKRLFKQNFDREIDLENPLIQDWEDYSQMLFMPYSFLQKGYDEELHREKIEKNSFSKI